MLRHYTKKLRIPHNHPKGKFLTLMAILTGIGKSSFVTIFPLILLSKLHNQSYVGFYFSLIAVIGLLASLFSTHLFQKFSKKIIFKYSLLFSFITLMLMTIANTIWHLGGFDIVRAICIIFIGISLSLYIKDFSTKSSLAQKEGLFFKYLNIGWFIGPLLAGFTAKYFGNESVFILSGMFYLTALIIFLIQNKNLELKNKNDEKYDESIKSLFKTIFEFFKIKEFQKVFLVSLGFHFWWAIIGIYIPLHIKSLGFGQDVLGMVISASILPLIIMEPYIGKKASKFGVKRYIFWGFFILSTISATFIYLNQLPLLLLSLFVLINFGIAYIEPLKDTYFFEVAKKSEAEKYYGIYNTAFPIAYIFGPILGSFLIMLGGLNLLWAGTSLVLFIFMLFATRIKDKY